MQVSGETVHRIRAASRRLVRAWGFLGRTLADVDLAASSVHAIVEIGSSGGLTAKDLSERLRLEKSTVSRLCASLGAKGLVNEQRSGHDGRSKRLSLTSQGAHIYDAINRFADSQVRSAIAKLESSRVGEVVVGLEAYAEALDTVGDGVPGIDVEVEIASGYAPSLLARIVEMHAAYYSRHWGFGLPFEAKVAGDLADFAGRLGGSGCANGLWHAQCDGRVVGSIAIDGEDLGYGVAHLRWFITEDGLRGTGVGRRLLDAALAFVDARGMRETRLWTFAGLDAARRLYENRGFVLVHSAPGDQWGRVVEEQVFVRPMPD